MRTHRQLTEPREEVEQREANNQAPHDQAEQRDVVPAEEVVSPQRLGVQQHQQDRAEQGRQRRGQAEADDGSPISTAPDNDCLGGIVGQVSDGRCGHGDVQREDQREGRKQQRAKTEAREQRQHAGHERDDEHHDRFQHSVRPVSST